MPDPQTKQADGEVGARSLAMLVLTAAISMACYIPLSLTIRSDGWRPYEEASLGA